MSILGFCYTSNGVRTQYTKKQTITDLEEDGELEEGSSTVLKEIAALVSQTQSGSSHPDKSTTTRTVVYTDGSCLNQGLNVNSRLLGQSRYMSLFSFALPITNKLLSIMIFVRV